MLVYRVSLDWTRSVFLVSEEAETSGWVELDAGMELVLLTLLISALGSSVLEASDAVTAAASDGKLRSGVGCNPILFR